MTAIRLQVVRFQCPHCRLTRAKKTATEAHIDRCWQNPDVRACKTCVHYQPEVRDYGHQCHPGYHCGCNDWDESCTHPEGPDEDYKFPVLHCPLWESQTAPCAECTEPVPAGFTYCSTRCNNAGDRHDELDGDQ
ncbi:hypothetical protein ACGFZR_15515 [Streptomyces sp. NPDC048241]|uniref:hypothetical protein n=1 Tax=Streptomyces sp. NPDC048241 TaxID=3365521 RepID=UPI003721DD05